MHVSKAAEQPDVSEESERQTRESERQMQEASKLLEDAEQAKAQLALQVRLTGK